MPRPLKPPSLSWSEIGVLAMLAGLVVVGLAAQGLSLAGWLAATGFGAGVLGLAWLWRYTLRRAAAARPLTRMQRVWNLLVFVAWLAVMAVLLRWFAPSLL